MRNLVKREGITLVVALSVTLIGFCILAIVRLIDSETFLFIQILALSGLLIFSLYLFSSNFHGYLGSIVRGRELVSVLVMFTILSFSLLNIDRSRSIYLLKWISVSESSSLTPTVFINSHAQSEQDIRDLTQRLHEQEALGSVSLDSDSLNLTALGQIIVTSSYFLAKFESLDGFNSN